jgi:hypothetical protein
MGEPPDLKSNTEANLAGQVIRSKMGGVDAYTYRNKQIFFRSSFLVHLLYKKIQFGGAPLSG